MSVISCVVLYHLLAYNYVCISNAKQKQPDCKQVDVLPSKNQVLCVS